MTWKIACCLALILLPAAALAEEPAKLPPVGAAGAKVLSGMSIVGNDEAPKSLVIVPWKSSELGNTLDASRALDDGRRPVDRDVFLRELTYYEIRAGQ
jgi:hypothetical protein